MRALVMSPQAGGVGYYRGQVPADALRREGVDVEYLGNEPLTDTFPQWLYDNAKKYDLIHCGYFTNEEFIKYLLAARNFANIPIVTDIDDDILSVPEYNVAFKSYHKGAPGRKIARMQLRVSDIVTTSTKELAAVLGKDCAGTEVLPNALNPADWDGLPTNPKRGDDQALRLMFAGNVGRYGDLAEIKGALDAVMQKYENIRLFFLAITPDWAAQWLGDTLNPYANRAFFIRQCSLEHYRPILKWISPDIVMAPVQENVFNKSKSHIKAYDAAMVGASFICSDWDTYGAVPVEAAVKVSGDYQWREGLEQLIENKDLRDKLSGRLESWAREEWHIDKHVHKWLKLYEEVVRKGPLQTLDQVVRPGEKDANSRKRA